MDEEGAWPQDPDVESGTCNSQFSTLYVCKVLVAEELIIIESWIVEHHLSCQLQVVECSVNLSIWHTILPIDCHVDRVVGQAVCLEFEGIKDFLTAESTLVDEKVCNLCVAERAELFTIASSLI